MVASGALASQEAPAADVEAAPATYFGKDGIQAGGITLATHYRQLPTGALRTQEVLPPPRPRALKYSIICACWHMPSAGELYTDLGGDYYQLLSAG